MEPALQTSPPPPSPKRSAPRAWLAAQELPSVVSSETWDDMKRVQEALRQHELGDFQLAADLVETMMTDAWIGTKVRERVGALLGLQMELQPAPRRGAQPLATIKTTLDTMLRREDLWQIHFWAIWLGVGFGRVRWDTGPQRWTPYLEWWHPRHLAWRWDLSAYTVTAQDGIHVIRPDDPDWMLHTPHGAKRGWMQGLFRYLAVLWLLKQWTLRDWSRHNEVHGNPIRLAKVPAMADDETEKDRFLRAVAALGSESVIRVVTGDSPGTSYGLELVEPKSQAYETFGSFKRTLDDDIAIAIVGQNLTTKVEGGSHAAANVHKLIRNDILREDGAGLARTCQNGPIASWTEFHFGERARAPLLGWPTTPPEDGEAVAKKTKAFLETLAQATEVGVELDVDWFAKSVGVVLVTKEDGAPTRALPVKDWHVQQGVVTINEVREMLGLEPIEEPEPEEVDGESALPDDERPSRGLALADGESEEQAAVDAVADESIEEAGRIFGGWLTSLFSALREAPARADSISAAWLERTSPAPLQATTEPTLVRSWLLGWTGQLGTGITLSFPTNLLELAKRPHQDAIDYLRGKVPIPSATWKKLGAESRRHAFKVAALSQVRMVDDVQKALIKALSSGWTFERFEREVGPQLRQAWTKSRSRSAPKTAEAQAWRLETIFRTVTQSAYNAGRVKQLRSPANRKAMPYWFLSVVADERNCPVCGRLRSQKLVLPVDHPVWRRLIPPLHFCCRCTVVGLSAAQAKRMGISRRAPTVQAAEGFGEDPTQWKWKPDLKKLPPSLRRIAKGRLAAAPQ